MDRHFFHIAPNQIAKKRFFLDEKESHHASHVLRLPLKSEIWLLDGQGTGYRARIGSFNGGRLTGTILETIPNLGELETRLSLAIGSIRRERLEWALEKAVELGVYEIAVIHLNRSVHRHTHLSRLEAKVMAAAKQCGRSWFPPVKVWKDLERWMRDTSGVRLVCHSGPSMGAVLSSMKTLTPMTILVGPEGDFTEEELETIKSNGFQSVSLGSRRLRSETAAIAALALAGNRS
ncbi:MAG: 16S rRNA (uracil(1498)-N(3))-methyltransferase [FCB group bacterium]|nr:16S rRNA (uracil(1498)-N(3))-methyltransferase [FCB group bacterium]